MEVWTHLLVCQSQDRLRMTNQHDPKPGNLVVNLCNRKTSTVDRDVALFDNVHHHGRVREGEMVSDRIAVRLFRANGRCRIDVSLGSPLALLQLNSALGRLCLGESRTHLDHVTSETGVCCHRTLTVDTVPYIQFPYGESVTAHPTDSAR